MEDSVSTLNNVQEDIRRRADGINIAKMRELGPYNLPRLYASTFFLRSAFGVVTLIQPVYLKQLHEAGGPEFTGVQIGLIIGSIFITEIALVTVFGRLSDLMQRRVPFVALGNLIAAISLAFFSFYTSFSALFIIHAIVGIGAAMAMGPTLAMIGDSAKPENQGIKMGLFETVTFGGMAFGFLLGGVLYDIILGGVEGYGALTFAISAIFLVGGSYYASQMKEPHSKPLKEEFSILFSFYRETVQHFTMIGISLLILFVISVLSGISLLIQGEFSWIGAITGEGIDTQYVVILYGGGAALLTIGMIDFFMEITTAEEDKVPLGGEEHSHIQEVIMAFKDKELKKILPAWLIVMIILGTIVTFLPIILATGITEPGEGEGLSGETAVSHGMDVSAIGIFFVVGMFILGGMQIVFGKFVDRFGSRPILIIGVTSILILSAQIVFAVAFYPEWFIDPFSGIGLIFIIIAGITGLGVSAFGPAALAVLSHNSTHENRGTTGGIYSLLLGVGHIIGDLFGGILWDIGNFLGGRTGSALAIFIFIFVLALIAFLVVIRIGGKPKSWDEIDEVKVSEISTQT
jgi:MFS family permease